MWLSNHSATTDRPAVKAIGARRHVAVPTFAVSFPAGRTAAMTVTRGRAIIDTLFEHAGAGTAEADVGFGSVLDGSQVDPERDSAMPQAATHGRCHRARGTEGVVEKLCFRNWLACWSGRGVYRYRLPSHRLLNRRHLGARDSQRSHPKCQTAFALSRRNVMGRRLHFNGQPG